MSGSRQKILLGALAVLLLIAGWEYLIPDDSAPGVPAPSSRLADPEGGGEATAHRAAGQPASSQVKDVISLRLAELEERPTSIYSPGRDPWRFVEPPPPPPPPPPRPPTKAELAAAQAEAEARARALREQAAREAAEAAKRAPPLNMKCVGTFGPEKRKIAVLIDGADTIYDVMEGDTLPGKYVISQIGYESVEVRHPDFPEWSQRLTIGTPAPTPGGH